MKEPKKIQVKVDLSNKQPNDLLLQEFCEICGEPLFVDKICLKCNPKL